MQFYGFISNSHTAGLVSPDGSVDWLAFPRFDSPAVFAKILGTVENGYFRVYPDVDDAESSQEYIEDTNILKTTWRSAKGSATVYDYLTVGRPELRRLIRSDLPMIVELRPRFRYGLVQAAPTSVRAGAIFRNPLEREGLVFAINALHREVVDELEVHLNQGTWHLPPGHYELIAQYVADDEDRLIEAADAIAEQMADLVEDIESEPVNFALRQNVAFWRHSMTHLPPYHGPYRNAYRRSLLVLYGLTYQTNGAIIAAPTTSLPETIGETRQWDYRYAWVRDGSYAAEALLMAGDHVGSRRFLDFMLNCIDLQGKPFDAPFFHVDGTLIRGEHSLEWLSGYKNSVPCREGNAATRQLQLDIEGDFLWTVWRYYDLTHDTEFLNFYWHRIRLLVHWVERNHHNKDASLWEFREQDDYYTHSQLMCWVALAYGSKMAEALGEQVQAEHWKKTADKIRQRIDSDAYNNELGSYTQAFHGQAVDAALLVMPLYGYCAPDDPRFLGTLKQIENQLVSEHWVYRYASDMLGSATHPFVLATFWLARVYVRLGRMADSRRLVKGILQYRTELGLLGEHADQSTGEPHGNFPQGFSHLGLIMTLVEITQHQSAPVQ